MSTDVVDDFRACDTAWRIAASGPRAHHGVRAARARVHALEARLNAFDERSAVAQLAREGRVEDEHVAALVRRAIAYRARTRGAFDVARGTLERRVKARVRGGDAGDLDDAPAARYRVSGDVVTCDAPLDLNGIAKGYIVDQAQRALESTGARGFVDGGGDIAGATGPVEIESPYDASRALGVLDTRWCIATSSGAKRRRGAISHLYDARTGRVGARHDQVTVVARRDCTEADVLATTLAILPYDEGRALVDAWPGVEALWVDGGTLRASRGFGDHAWKA